ncbi:MAG TPA: protein translocase subunit SecF [Thermoanaerobaculia bacterium]|nr:protein translocase subunit SecF [Thermoanaerobaculia bacterium]
MEFLQETNIDFMKYRRFWVVLSLVLVVISVLAIFVHGKLNVGVDFAGGTQLTLQFQQQPEVDELRSILAAAGLADTQIQSFGEAGSNEVLIRAPLGDEGATAMQERILAAFDERYNAERSGLDLNRSGRDGVASLLDRLDPEGVLEGGGALAESYYEGIAESILDRRQELGIFSSWEQVAAAEGVSPEILEALRENASQGTFALLGAENVTPQVGRELRIKGIWAVVLSLIGMLIYIWIRFELRFGIGAVLASFHDVMVVLGFYALLDFEFNLTTVAAFLTLVGYSVNDTVVIFDRVRENLRLTRRAPLLEVINRSVNQTLSRTVLTSGTTLLATGALLIWGGDVLRGFAFVLTVGIVVGTYSSVYVASPFAVLWEELTSRRRAVTGKGAPKAAGGATGL